MALPDDEAIMSTPREVLPPSKHLNATTKNVVSATVLFKYRELGVLCSFIGKMVYNN